MKSLWFAIPVLTLLSACTSQQPFNRSVPLEGQSNFRDVGGYKTVDGRIVKTGILYRSGEMQALSDTDMAILSMNSLFTFACSGKDRSRELPGGRFDVRAGQDLIYQLRRIAEVRPYPL